MKMSLLIIGAGVLVVGSVAGYYFYAQQIKALQSTDYKIIGLRIIEAKKDKAKIELTIRLFSKSRIEAEIKDFYLEVSLDNKKVADIEPVESIILPANGYADSKFTVSFNPQTLGLDALSLTLGYLQNKNFSIRVLGNAKVRSPIFAFPGAQKPIPIYASATLPIDYNTTLKELIS